MTELSRTHLNQLENQSIFIFRGLITPSKILPCGGQGGRIPMFSAGSRANPFLAKSRSNIAHRHDLMPELAIKHYNFNLIVEIRTKARERNWLRDARSPDSRIGHSVDESVMKILEQYRHA